MVKQMAYLSVLILNSQFHSNILKYSIMVEANIVFLQTKIEIKMGNKVKKEKKNVLF